MISGPMWRTLLQYFEVKRFLKKARAAIASDNLRERRPITHHSAVRDMARRFALPPDGEVGRLGDMKLTAIFEPAAEGGYVCWLEEMPGVQTQGDSLAEARANLLDALK